MFKFPKFRSAALAMLAVGVMGLRAAPASASSWVDACDDEAIAVLVGACDYITGGDWYYGEMTYWCDDSGHLAYGEGACYS